jgi:hypothetical protein
MKLREELATLSHQINQALLFVDPQFHTNITRLRKRMGELAFAKALFHIDPLLFEGREFLFNSKSGVHRDSLDPQLGWVALVALGSFKGGDVWLPQLGIKVRLEPGDMVLLRGRVVKHGFEAHTGGQRICVPHFTHTSAWVTYNLHGLVSIS